MHSTIIFLCFSIAIPVLTKGTPLAENTNSWCDPVLGCLYLTPEWTSSMRPINVQPESRAKIATRFFLHTKENPCEKHEPQVPLNADDLSTITTSTFDPHRPTKMITHGFIDTGNTTWVFDMVNALLNYGDYNVIRVDWGHGSLPMYSQACANIRVVGLEIGHLVNTMKLLNHIDPATIHLLGHSLGAHASGYAGEKIENLGRISGLDPAGPYFTGTDTFIRLDPSDATYVDAIHTDADSIFLLGYGTAQPMGNVDFYPNSGHDQPNCDPVSVAIDSITDEMVGVGRNLVACSHNRAIEYYQETLTSASCNWLSHSCYSYDNFEEGMCGSCGDDNSLCAFMGYKADEFVNKKGIYQMFYLDTDGDDPYCMQHYQVSILTAAAKGAESWVMGNLKLTLYGDSGAVIHDVMITDKHQRIDHGQITNTLFLSHNDVGTILRAELEWNYNDNVYNPGTWCWNLVCNKSLYVSSIQITPINYYPESAQEAKVSLMCSVDGSDTRIKDKHTASFVQSGNCEPLDGH